MINIYKDINIRVFENPFKTKKTPVPTGQKTIFKDSDIAFAQIIIGLKSFRNHIYQARKNINQKTPIDYPADNDIKSIIDLQMNLDDSKRQHLMTAANKIILFYRLPQNWYFGVVSAVFTNILLVPPDAGIYFYDPSDMPGYPAFTKLKTGTNNNVAFYNEFHALRAFELSSRPNIYFTRASSRNEFDIFINKHWKKIQNSTESYARNRKVKISDDTIFWGQIAQIFHEHRIKWTQAVILIDKKDNNNPFKMREYIYKNQPPAPKELSQYYRNYISTVSKIDSTFRK